MIPFSAISLFSAFISIFAILIVFSIFKKVLQEKYKRPWLFIGISTIILATNQLLRFVSDFYGVNIINLRFTQAIIYSLDFISIIILTYGLLLEQLILKYYKGKFVKMKFIPVQEGSLDGEIDLNVSNGNSYLALKKDRTYLFNEFSQATKKGYEGFLIAEENPREIRKNYDLQKTPIGWVSHIDKQTNSSYLKDSLDENSDVIDPIQLNNIINYIDNFLEQSQNPFLLIELNLILRTNNYSIILEFLKYVSQRIKTHNGILIWTLNIDILKKDQVSELKQFMIELE
jgi:hypothetical protein